MHTCRVKDTEVLPALLECVTAETPLQLLDFVPDGGLWKVAPPLAFKINPLNEAPDNVTVTVLLAVLEGAASPCIAGFATWHST